MNVEGIRIGERRRGGGRRATDRFHVQHSNSAHRRLRILIGIAGVILLICSAFILGVKSTGYRYDAARQEFKLLSEHAAWLETQYADLLERVNQLQQSPQIESRVAASSQEILVNLQDHMLAPSGMTPDLHVREFELQRVKPGEYRYTLVLARIRGHSRLAEGEVELYVDGTYVDEDKPTRLRLSELSRQRGAIAFSFESFQTIEGHLAIPAKFTPAKIVLQIKLAGAQLKTLKKTWLWTAVVQGP